MRLRTVHPYQSPGFRRIDGSDRYAPSRRGGGPTRVLAKDAARADRLVIPPAWTNVWVAAAENAHIQAVGVDGAGRTQYLYHPDWQEKRQRLKFERARQLAEHLPAARARVTRDLRRSDLGRVRVLAVAFRILDTLAVRVGSEQYTNVTGSRGLTTLQRRHVTVNGNTVRLDFPGKSGKRSRASVEDADLATAVKLLLDGPPRGRLLSWSHGEQSLAPADVNGYLKSMTGGEFTAKDFRTLKGTIAAAQYLASVGRVTTVREQRAAIRDAAVAASRLLGNTPTVARTSYIDPEVIDRFISGEVMDTHTAPESALLKLLNGRP